MEPNNKNISEIYKELKENLPQLKEEAIEGNIDPLELHCYLKSLHKEVDKFKKDEDIENLAIDEADKFPENSFDHKGFKVQLSNTGDSLKFEEDPVYAELKKKLKDRENLLKTRSKSDEEVHDSEGMEIPKVSVKNPSKRTLRIKS